MQRNPFSAGRWVCDDDFFGRTDLIATVENSADPCHWIIGKRRVGKTSLLRQLERRANKSDDVFALYWDIQGSYDPDGLYDALYDAVEDSRDLYEDLWDGLDLNLDDDHGGAPQLLKKLARKVTSQKGRRFRLLIDEAEELINIGKQDPGLLSKLRRFFQGNRNNHTVIASTPRLEQLYQAIDTQTSPFLHGFSVSFLGNLEREACAALLQRGFEDEATRTKLHDLTDGDPFETQLLAKHYFEHPDLDEVLLQLETNPMLNQTIEVNFGLLDEREQAFLRRRQESDGAPSLDAAVKAMIRKLTRMGYLTQKGDRLGVGSYFQARFLGARPLEPAPPEINQAGVPLKSLRPSMTLSNMPGLYQIFFELAQKDQRLADMNALHQDPQDGSVYLESEAQLESLPPDGEIGHVYHAVHELGRFLDDLVSRDHSWALFRFHQMRETEGESYSEQDFLDVMMLIAEEASLEN